MRLFNVRGTLTILTAGHQDIPRSPRCSMHICIYDYHLEHCTVVRVNLQSAANQQSPAAFRPNNAETFQHRAAAVMRNLEVCLVIPTRPLGPSLWVRPCRRNQDPVRCGRDANAEHSQHTGHSRIRTNRGEQFFSSVPASPSRFTVCMVCTMYGMYGTVCGGPRSSPRISSKVRGIKKHVTFLKTMQRMFD